MEHLIETRRYEFKGLSIFLVSEEYRKSINESEWPDKRVCNLAKDNLAKKNLTEERKKSLVIYQDEKNSEQNEPISIVQVELYGPVAWQDAYEELSLSDLKYDFDMRWHRRASLCCFGAEPGHDTPDWNTILHALLEFSLVDGRPVRSFKTTFMFPFTIRKDEYAPAEKIRFRQENLRAMDVGHGDVETVLYFLPHIRDILFARDVEGKDVSEDCVEPIHRYGLISQNYRLRLDGKKIPLDVEHVRFFLFPNNNICVLSYAVTLPGMEDVDWDTIEKPLDFLRHLTQEGAWETIENFQAHTCLTVNNLARIVYPTFREQQEEKKIAQIELLCEEKLLATFYKGDPGETVKTSLRPKISQVVEHLVKEGLDIGNGHILPMLDDRMFVNSHIALWGEKPGTDAGRAAYQAFFSVALYVDQEGEEHLDGYVYDPEFVKKQMEHEVLWRWHAHSGNLYGFTNYSNVYMGFGRFLANIAPRHIHNHYFYMALLALYYRTSMIGYLARLARTSKRLLKHPNKEESRADIRKLRGSFIEFTNQYWFREITSQMQGIEIFDHQYRVMNIEREYSEFKEEIERADDFIQMAWQDEMSDNAVKFAFIGLAFAIIAPLISWFAIGSDVFAVKEIISRSGSYIVFLFTAAVFGTLMCSVIVIQKSLLNNNVTIGLRSFYDKAKGIIRKGNCLSIVKSALNALKACLKEKR